MTPKRAPFRAGWGGCGPRLCYLAFLSGGDLWALTGEPQTVPLAEALWCTGREAGDRDSAQRGVAVTHRLVGDQGSARHPATRLHLEDSSVMERTPASGSQTRLPVRVWAPPALSPARPLSKVSLGRCRDQQAVRRSSGHRAGHSGRRPPRAPGRFLRSFPFCPRYKG